MRRHIPILIVSSLVGLGTFGSATMVNKVTHVESLVVGKTPEGCHRKCLSEFAMYLQKLNPDLVVPEPYELPDYLDHPLHPDNVATPIGLIED